MVVVGLARTLVAVDLTGIAAIVFDRGMPVEVTSTTYRVPIRGHLPIPAAVSARELVPSGSRA